MDHVTTGGVTSTNVLTTDGDDTVLPAASLHVSCHSCRPSDRSWEAMLPLVVRAVAFADMRGDQPSLLFT